MLPSVRARLRRRAVSAWEDRFAYACMGALAWSYLELLIGRHL